MVLDPTSIGIASNGCGANSEQAANFFQVELRIEEPFDEFLPGFLKFSGVIVGSNGVIVQRGQEHHALGEVCPNLLQFGVDGVGDDVVGFSTRAWRAHFRLAEFSSGQLDLSSNIFLNAREVLILFGGAIEKGTLDVLHGVKVLFHIDMYKDSIKKFRI